MTDKTTNLTVFIRVKVENDQDILIGVKHGEDPNEVLKNFVDEIGWATENKEMTELVGCERVPFSLFKKELHYFTGKIYVNPTKVVEAYVDADTKPVASDDEKIDLYEKLARACANDEEKGLANEKSKS